jgi:anti-sigma factor RsiW
MWPSNRISEDEINRFLDGELTQPQRSDLQARLALEPELAAEVFAQAQRMEALRVAQPQRLFPPRASLDRAKQLESAFRRRRLFNALKLQMAAALLVLLGWSANSLTLPIRQGGQTTDQTFILAARDALRVAQLNAGPEKGSEPKQDRIERLVGAINISMPALPAVWVVKDVQVQPWNGRQSLVVTADTPSVGRITLVAVAMSGEDAVPPTPATDGRVPTVYWQSGGTAYALMGPAATDRLEKEAKEIEVATRRNVTPKIRG